MTLILDLAPEEERFVQSEAAKRSLTAEEYARDVLTQGMGMSAPPIRYFDPAATERDLAKAREQALAMLERLEAEDATDDPEEIRKASDDLREFKAAMNANRRSEHPIYP